MKALRKIRLIFKKAWRDITYDVMIAIVEMLVRIAIITGVIIWIVKTCN